MAAMFCLENQDGGYRILELCRYNMFPKMFEINVLKFPPNLVKIGQMVEK